jgi:hypothetical protein
MLTASKSCVDFFTRTNDSAVIQVVDEQHSDRYIFYANTWLNAAHGLETVLKSARDVEVSRIVYLFTPFLIRVGTNTCFQ